MAMNNYLELAICGTHLGETKGPTSIDSSPLYVSLLMSCYLVLRSMIFFFILETVSGSDFNDLDGLVDMFIVSLELNCMK